MGGWSFVQNLSPKYCWCHMLHPPSLALLKYLIFLHFHWSRLPSPDGVSGAPAALSFNEGKLQRDRRNNHHHFWLSDICPCSCHSPCLLSWCYCKQPSMCLHFQSSDWLEIAERGGIEAYLDVMLVCTSFWTLFCMLPRYKSSNSLHFFVFLFCFWVVSSFDGEHRLSTPVWGTTPVYPAHPSPCYTGLILPSAGLCMDPSEEIVWVPKVLQSQSLKTRKKYLDREKQNVPALSPSGYGAWVWF